MNKLNYSKVFVDREEIEELENHVEHLQKQIDDMKKEEFKAFRYTNSYGYRIGMLSDTELIFFRDEELGKMVEDLSQEKADLKLKLHYNKGERGQIKEFNSLPWYKKMFYKFEIDE